MDTSLEDVTASRSKAHFKNRAQKSSARSQGTTVSLKADSTLTHYASLVHVTEHM